MNKLVPGAVENSPRYATICIARRDYDGAIHRIKRVGNAAMRLNQYNLAGDRVIRSFARIYLTLSALRQIRFNDFI